MGIETDTGLAYSVPAWFYTKSYCLEEVVADLCKSCGTVIRLYVQKIDRTWEPRDPNALFSRFPRG